MCISHSKKAESSFLNSKGYLRTVQILHGRQTDIPLRACIAYIPTRRMTTLGAAEASSAVCGSVICREKEPQMACSEDYREGSRFDKGQSHRKLCEGETTICQLLSKNDSFGKNHSLKSFVKCGRSRLRNESHGRSFFLVLLYVCRFRCSCTL